MTRIPSQSEYARWRDDYKRRYKAAFAVPDELLIEPNDFKQGDSPEANDPAAAKEWMQRNEAATAVYESSQGYFIDVAQAQSAGLDARLNRNPISGNPFEEATDKWFAWFKGYGLYDPYVKAPNG